MNRLAPAAVALVAALTAACTETERNVPASTRSNAAATSTAAPTAGGTTVITTVPPVTPAPTTPPPTASPTAAPAASAPATTAPPTPSPTSAPSPTRTPGPTPPPGASLPPMPSQPPLASDVRTVASGTVSFNIAPGETRSFEAATLAFDRGASPPPTAALSWTVAWRATDSLTSAWYRQGSRTEIGRGRWGTADMGGVGFELRNDTRATIYGELSFLIGSR